MGDLKIENLRLQKFADILDSQPELTFCIDKTGQITFMSDSASNFMKTTNADDNDDDPTHISQILTEESVGTVLDCVAQIRAEQCASQGLHGDHDGSGCISSVQVKTPLSNKRSCLLS
jgi:PAS domain-containing protein